MGKNKKKSKPKSEVAGPPMAVGGLKIIDTTTKSNKPKSGGAGSPAAASETITNKKQKVAQESKSNLTAEKPPGGGKAKQSAATSEVTGKIPKPVDNNEIPETDAKTGLEHWDEVDENSFNFPAIEAKSNAEPADTDKQNDHWFEENRSSHSTGSASNNALLNKDTSASPISKDEYKTVDYAKKGAVHKELQHNNSYGSKNNQREFGNGQQQGRGRSRGSNLQNTDYQGNQRESEGYQNRNKDGGENSSRDNYRNNQRRPEDPWGKRSRERGNDSRQSGDHQRESGKNQEENKRKGNFDASAWSPNNDQQGSPQNFGNNREQSKGSGHFDVSVWPSNNLQQGYQKEFEKNKTYRSGDTADSSRQPRNYQDGKRDSGYREQNRSQGNRSQDDGSYQRKSNVEWQNYRSSDRNSEEKDKEFDEFWKYYKASREKNYVKVHEMEGDLFAMPKEYSLAHCVAEDMAMGSGIAVQFSRDFKRRDELFQQRQKQGGLAVLEIEQRYIYYLVTKRESTGKPTYHTLWCSLQKMQQHVQEHEVTKLAMPRIGCGLDRLEWSQVKAMVEYTFRTTDVEITICNFQQPEDGSLPVKSSKCPVRNVKYPLTQIEPYTAVVYFGSEDGFVTEEIDSLDAKFKILQDYKNGNKRVGEVIQSFRLQNKYIVYGFIISKSKNDVFDFINLQKCISSFKKFNTKENACSFVGIQAFLDDDDDLILTKIVNVLRYALYGVEIYVCWPDKMVPFMPQDRRDNYNY